jgi:mRNA interferase RelE/StbE
MWRVEYLRDALEDLKRLDHSQRFRVVKAVKRVALNPLPRAEGGYGKPLGNKDGINLVGYCKIKLLKLGLRVVYQVVREKGVMKIIVVSARADDEVYLIAQKRIEE